MKRVKVRKLKRKATRLLRSGEALVIERHGRPIGFYIPIVAKDRATGHASLDRLGETVNDILDSTGMTEEELVAEFTRDDFHG